MKQGIPFIVNISSPGLEKLRQEYSSLIDIHTDGNRVMIGNVGYRKDRKGFWQPIPWDEDFLGFDKELTQKQIAEISGL